MQHFKRETFQCVEAAKADDAAMGMGHCNVCNCPGYMPFGNPADKCARISCQHDIKDHR